MRRVIIYYLWVLVLPGSFLIAQLEKATSAESSVYLLSHVDKLSISVYGEPDLSSDQRISDQGTV